MVDKDINYMENNETKKAVRKKVIVKSKHNKESNEDLNFSIYGHRRQSRIYAMLAIYSYDINGRDIDIETLLKFEYEDKNIPNSVEVFAKDLIYGTIEHIDEIDSVIEKYSQNWDIKRIQYVDKAIIRMSIYCLIYHKDIPKSVVIDEAIEIAKIFSDKDSYKFINGILDGIQKKEVEN